MIKHTELFYSIQGEGKFTGQASVFLRLWKCNLHCAGFSQENPMNSDTWDLSFREYDPLANDVKSIDELPIFGKGCDSEYSHNPKFEYLAERTSPEDMCDMILDLLPNREWGSIHFILTGGEPLLSQRQIMSLLTALDTIGKRPPSITIETNGTRNLTDEFKMFLIYGKYNLNFSVSPKLQNVTGELPSKAIHPNIVNIYKLYGDVWLKPVVVDKDECWDELDSMMAKFKEEEHLKDVPIYVMPCGATKEEQEKESYMESIADKALSRGHNVSARVHCWIWKNKTGT
jgi:7-carboxy-7-deazaguanine synthase